MIPQQTLGKQKHHYRLREDGHSAAVVDGIIYVIGGGYSAALQIVCTRMIQWLILGQQRQNLLNPRRGAQAGVVDSIIYNIGGNQSERNCEAYNPVTNTWTAKTNMPGGGGAVAVTVYNGLIYTFGGSGSGWQPYSNVYAYNPQNDTWVQKQNMPTARFGLLTYLVGNKIYAIGGSQAQYTSLAKVEVYDPVTRYMGDESGYAIYRLLFCRCGSKQ